MIFNTSIYAKSIPDLSNPGSESDLLSDKQLVDQDGNVITGTMPNVSQATPSISIDGMGLITASSTQSTGYVTGGTKSATNQLSTQSGTTITPSTSTKTAVPSGKYTTGNIYVAGDSNLVSSNIKSGVSIFGVSGNYTGSGSTSIEVDDYATPSGSKYGSGITDYTADLIVGGAPNDLVGVFTYVYTEKATISELSKLQSSMIANQSLIVGISIFIVNRKAVLVSYTTFNAEGNNKILSLTHMMANPASENITVSITPYGSSQSEVYINIGNSSLRKFAYPGDLDYVWYVSSYIKKS